MRKFGSLALAAACVLAAASYAIAATPAERVASRQQNFKAMGRAFKAVNDELKKDAPDVGIVRPYANALGRFGTQLPRWFPAGTGMPTGIKNGAKDAIWQNRAAFALAAGNFRTASQALVRASRGSDLVAIGVAARTLGGTCKGCHDSFREKTD